MNDMTPAVVVTVTIGDRPSLVYDQSGRILAPLAASERATVAVALAQASAALALTPGAQDTIADLNQHLHQLAEIGTPAADEARIELEEAMAGLSAGMQRAAGVMNAAAARRAN